MSAIATAATPFVAPRCLGGARPLAAGCSKPSLAAFAPARRAAPRAARAQVKATAMLAEVAQLAESEAGFIGGVAGTMVAMTLIGLAFGFILLRVESLAEEGKI